ncbi:MAG: transcription termination factor NusA, partial [Patescibacteria group bacterium]
VVEFNPETGEMKVFDVKTVVADVDLEEEAKKFEEWKIEQEAKVKEAEEKREMPPEPEHFTRFNPKIEVMKSEIKKEKEFKKAKLGDVARRPLAIPNEFGRMAAQTAKQVIIQKLREAERQMVFGEFKGKEGELAVGTVGRREGRNILVDLGTATAILPEEEQIKTERYNPGARIKVYVVAVNMAARGPEIRVSRSHPDMVRKIFSLEIPEIASGVVEIKGVAREAGARSKVAVWTADEDIDPIGSCIGQRGTRIQTIIAELGGEKIDVIAFHEDQPRYVANALSPAKVISVEINEESKSALVKVATDQYSLSIGRGGQNVRLASQLTGWQIVVEEQKTEVPAAVEEVPAEAPAEEKVTEESPKE